MRARVAGPPSLPSGAPGGDAAHRGDEAHLPQGDELERGREELAEQGAKASAGTSDEHRSHRRRALRRHPGLCRTACSDEHASDRGSRTAAAAG